MEIGAQAKCVLPPSFSTLLTLCLPPLRVLPPKSNSTLNVAKHSYKRSTQFQVTADESFLLL